MAKNSVQGGSGFGILLVHVYLGWSIRLKFTSSVSILTPSLNMFDLPFLSYVYIYIYG